MKTVYRMLQIVITKFKTLRTKKKLQDVLHNRKSAIFHNKSPSLGKPSKEKTPQ